MVTLSAAEVSRQALEVLLAHLLIVVPAAARAIEERLSRGESPEQILKEWAKSAAEDPTGKGLARVLQAAYYVQQARFEEAVTACQAAHEVWPEGSPVIRYLEGHLSLFLKQYDESFNAFRESDLGFLHPYVTPLKGEVALASWAKKQERDFYSRWALVGIVQGLEGLAGSNLAGFEAGGEKVIAVLKAAGQAGHEAAVWEIMDKVEATPPPEQRPFLEELRLYVRLGLIDDPFERWKALGEEISKVWPEGVSAVDAIREQRDRA